MEKIALILIDIQKGISEPGYYGQERNNPNAETNASLLLNFWREKKLPVFHVKHNSTNPSSPLAKGKVGNQIMEIVQPIENEPIIEKNVNSAFIGTDLKDQLENKNIKKVVIAGLTTEHCISTSTRMANNLGFETILIYDATAAFDKEGPGESRYSAQMIHDIEIANLKDEFASVFKTNEFLKRMNKDFKN